jgi:hypothetical protein
MTVTDHTYLTELVHSTFPAYLTWLNNLSTIKGRVQIIKLTLKYFSQFLAQNLRMAVER